MSWVRTARRAQEKRRARQALEPTMTTKIEPRTRGVTLELSEPWTPKGETEIAAGQRARS